MEEEDDDEDMRLFFSVDRIPASKQPVDSAMVRMLGFEKSPKSPMASSILRSNSGKMFILGVLIVFSLTTFSSVCNSMPSLNDFEEFTVFPEIVESATTESQLDVQLKEDNMVQFSEIQSEVLSYLVFISNASAYASIGDSLILEVVRSRASFDLFLKADWKERWSRFPRC